MQLLDINSNIVDPKEYHSVTDNSKAVTKGGIFVAIRGNSYDGHDAIKEALKNGAALIVIDKSRVSLIPSISSARIAIADNSRLALSYIASKLYKKPDNIVAVTGTNGKTSVAYFFQQLLSRLDQAAASIGTLGIISDNKTLIETAGSLTTPGALQLHKLLQDIKDKSVNYVALEASSHGLIQNRLDYIPFKGAAFTSFSRDHLDYHKTMDEYLQAKFYLFERLLSKGSFALINSELEVVEPLVRLCKAKGLETLTYGHSGNFLRIKSISYANNNSFVVAFTLAGREHQFICNLLGRFQIYNILCTLGLLVSLGFAIEKLLPLLENLSNVPGRMQRVDTSNAYVDYAHTPDALEGSLKSIREFMSHRSQEGRVIVVFGCGGERDKGKRAVMGKIAHELADVVIVTDDNPRSEDPSEIRKAIIKACPTAIEIPDRELAIKHAIQNSKPSDIILLAGKGHEKLQLINGQSFEFSDVEVARKYLA
jgi:UDP-N-acetylmuramoyl-L-alanyl-D-glutamate--2,6-diaminopimelate ligase